MKTILFSLYVLMHMVNCQQENVDINYRAQSRGFLLDIAIESDSLKFRNTEGSQPQLRILTKEELAQLKILVTAVDFDNVSKPDTSKSSYDAAAMAHLNIATVKRKYQFNFDHEHPPKELEALVNKIITLSQIVE